MSGAERARRTSARDDWLDIKKRKGKKRIKKRTGNAEMDERVDYCALIVGRWNSCSVSAQLFIFIGFLPDSYWTDAMDHFLLSMNEFRWKWNDTAARTNRRNWFTRRLALISSLCWLGLASEILQDREPRFKDPFLFFRDPSEILQGSSRDPFMATSNGRGRGRESTLFGFDGDTVGFFSSILQDRQSRLKDPLLFFRDPLEILQ